MEALGSYLKEVREKLNLSVEKVVEDTHIVRKFLDAIENDEYTIFPGEAYLKGFLRTYSEYLGIDSEDIIKRYEKIKMAESPTPVEQLIPKSKFDFKPVLTYAGIGLGAILAIFVIVLVIINVSKSISNIKFEKKDNQVSEQKLDDNIIRMIDKESTFNLKKKGIVEFNIGSEKHYLKIKELSPTVIISDNNNKDYILIKSYQQKIDMNNDKNNDLDVSLNSWNDKNANITIRLYSDGGEHAGNSSVGSANMIGENTKTVVKKPAPENITFEISFQDESFIRYKIDDKPDVEAYNKPGSIISITATKSAIVWLANAGAASFNFKSYNKTFKPGDVGKIDVKLIKWVQGAGGEQELQISSLK